MSIYVRSGVSINLAKGVSDNTFNNQIIFFLISIHPSFHFLSRLVLNGLRKSCVFEGLPGRLLLTYDLAALDMRMYYKAGVLIGWSLAHCGPGPHCLHPALYQVVFVRICRLGFAADLLGCSDFLLLIVSLPQLMCRKNPSLEDFSWSEIVSTEVQSWLQQVPHTHVHVHTNTHAE